jgi:hypothetical protein
MLFGHIRKRSAAIGYFQHQDIAFNMRMDGLTQMFARRVVELDGVAVHLNSKGVHAFHEFRCGMIKVDFCVRILAGTSLRASDLHVRKPVFESLLTCPRTAGGLDQR